MSTVHASIETLRLPTYPVGAPERNPVFFEKRVYQGSNGKVYPVPFIDKVYDKPEPVDYRSVRLENEFVRLVLLPEIGGRLLRAQDKTNGDYDFFYRQDVIKPALVGLAGPWISGGVEFNWPQHHRPGTFLPTDLHIEEEEDGARTVWFSELDPISRLKGMHGFRLRPGSSLIELRVRLHNRTPLTQSFLWWANVAAKVHEQYQSFFPPDVRYVADHAVRAMSSFPNAEGTYYGVDYGARRGAKDLSWYRNIPVPTSYMVCETAYDFFGGYDHAAQGGFVHVADRHIAPGKKQWTWGNHGFGYAWDRELTDNGGPYIELMAGVYTDNQPDFSYLLPGETKTFSQFWWPIQKCGPVQNANREAALRLVCDQEGRLDIAALVSRPRQGLRLTLTQGNKLLLDKVLNLEPGSIFQEKTLRFQGSALSTLELRLCDQRGQELLRYRPAGELADKRTRAVAKAPSEPGQIGSSDELFHIGEHLELYRHPTRSPEAYWQEALKRDPADARCNLALAKRRLREGCFAEAREFAERSIGRGTSLHPNPASGEAHYVLGLALRHLAELAADTGELLEQAYAAFYKATWNYEWRSPAHYQLACIDAARGAEARALEHLEACLSTNADHNQALVLKMALLRRSGLPRAALALNQAVLAKDPLEPGALFEKALLEDCPLLFLERSRNDAQTVLDLALDMAWAGLWDDAASLLRLHQDKPLPGAPVPNPLGRSQSIAYLLAWITARAGDEASAASLLQSAGSQSPDYFFPSRNLELVVLNWALQRQPGDPVAAFGLGNLLYDRRRHTDAIALWENAVSLKPGLGHATLHRNLGVAHWNIRREGERARQDYARALACDPKDARLVYEADQLAKKLNIAPEQRLKFLLEHRELVLLRDDASVELAALHNRLGHPDTALKLLLSRRFHPWEGGEGAVLRQYTFARLALGRQALDKGQAAEALAQFQAALEPPPSLGEAYHLFHAKADVNLHLGLALRALGRNAEAREAWRQSAAESCDFQDMAVAAHSPLSLHRGLALRALGEEQRASALFHELRDYGLTRIGQKASIDYFATSLPNLLVFEEDLQARKDAEFHLLAAMGHAGLGEQTRAEAHLAAVLAFQSSDLNAAELRQRLDEAKGSPLHV